MNQLINHEAVYRTAPATPGVLITSKMYCDIKYKWIVVALRWRQHGKGFQSTGLPSLIEDS